MVETTYEAQVRQIAAFDDLLDYFQAQKPRWDGDVASAQAAYAALSSNLKNVVKNEMNFSVEIDPDAANPSEITGGVFNYIGDAIDAAPRGALVTLNLLAGKEHTVDRGISLLGRQLYFKQKGVGDRPVLKIGAISDENFNHMRGFDTLGSESLTFHNIDIQFPEKNDPALPWSSLRSLVRYTSVGTRIVSLTSCDITGIDNQSIASSVGAGISIVSLNNTVMDGAIYAVSSMSSGVALISKLSLTLQNGAGLNEGGTLGTNYLMN
ncbi:hypothetical protein [Sulfitobacter pontiacus]|uniref:hypothetical protein n=1 Tax=Sulfitobacter pontiacus TaxID=60137 RepID=UPI0021A41A9F|nr:hypothetical protein [Sulfitobacter pontiacus]UWR20219.1 hypothetical protein K3755_07135 [Sulfitobacter pontiacus]